MDHCIIPDQMAPGDDDSLVFVVLVGTLEQCRAKQHYWGSPQMLGPRSAFPNLARIEPKPIIVQQPTGAQVRASIYRLR